MIQAVRDLQRLREIAAVVARHGFGELLDRSRIWDVLGRREPGERPAPSESRASTARRFRETLAELGPTFIKLGQILSSRPDIVPADFIAELSTLQDGASPMPVATVLEAIEQGLGQPASQLFAWVDPEPLASASIAQVHRARLRNASPGQDGVVLKVQRPGIEQQIRADAALLETLARFLEGVLAETGPYTPTSIVAEFRTAMLAELDFESEARNIEEFGRNHGDREFVVVPRIYRELSCKTVLTLQELKGHKLSAVLEQPALADRALLARRLLDASFQQVFTDGLFHADPHPGNVLVLDGNRFGLLDFGLVGRLSSGMQESLLLLVLALSVRDADTVARVLYKVGVPDGRIPQQQFRAAIHALLDRYLGLKLSDVDARSLLRDLVDLAIQFKIKLPREYALLSKAAATIEGTLRVLAPDLDIAQEALPYAKRLLAERYNPTQLSGGALRALLQLQGFLQDTPHQLSQILTDLEGGKFLVTVHSEELARLNTNMKALGILLFMGSIASGLIVGAFSLVGRTASEGATGRWPVPALVGLFLAAMLFGAAVSWTLLSGRIKKVSIRRWLK